MRSHALAWFLIGSTSLASAQAELLTSGLPASARKFVVHDHGSLWYGALVRLLDGSVWGLGNPWLGGGAQSLSLHATDLARLDANTPGDPESVAVVGNAGLSIVRWDDTTHTYTVVSAGDTGSVNGNYIRTAPFPAPQHTIALLAPGGASVRVFRDTTLVATPTVTGPVRDLELFQTASGVGLLIVRNDTSVTCKQLSGATVWTEGGYDGDVVRWPPSATIRACWINRPTLYGNWRLTLLGDGGVISTLPLGSVIANGEQLVAAFAADADHDGDVDIFVKTSAGASILVDTSGGAFASVQEVDIPTMSANVQCIPALLSSQAGERLRLVDQRTDNDVAWRRVDLPLDSEDDGTGLSLVPKATDPEVGGLVNATVEDPNGEGTHVTFLVNTTQTALAGFAGNDREAYLQVVSWRQETSESDGRVIAEAETNWLFPLTVNLPATESTWPLRMDLAPVIAGLPEPNESLGGWVGQDDDALYWLTVRLCTRLLTESHATKCSEPITLVTSMSSHQYGNEWSYILEWCDGAFWPLIWNGSMDGGLIVGGIQKVTRPPPALPMSQIPVPRAAVPKDAIGPAGQ